MNVSNETDEMGDVVDLFRNPASREWLAEFAHSVMRSSSANHRKKLFPTSCRFFQFFYTMILVASDKGYQIPPITRRQHLLLREAVQRTYDAVESNPLHELYPFYSQSLFSEHYLKPYDLTVPHTASHEVLCFVRKGVDPLGSPYAHIAHYFSRIHTADRGDWILTAYGSCFIQSPGTLLPLDPATWEAFVKAMNESSTEQHPVIRSFMMTYFLQGSFETFYENDEMTSDPSLYGQPVTNREERELSFLYDPSSTDRVTFALYYYPHFEDYLQLPSPSRMEKILQLEKSGGGRRCHKKQITRRRKSRQTRTRRRLRR